MAGGLTREERFKMNGYNTITVYLTKVLTPEEQAIQDKNAQEYLDNLFDSQ